MQRKTISDYHNLARKRGFKWVGKIEPKSVMEETQWQCQFGHVWSTRYQHIRNGYGCPYCYGNAKHTAADYNALAARHGIKWREDLWGNIGNVNDPMLWQLPRGQIFVDTYHNLNCKQTVVAEKPHYSMRRIVTDEEIASGEWREKWKNRKKTE